MYERNKNKSNEFLNPKYLKKESRNIPKNPQKQSEDFPKNIKFIIFKEIYKKIPKKSKKE